MIPSLSTLPTVTSRILLAIVVPSFNLALNWTLTRELGVKDNDSAWVNRQITFLSSKVKSASFFSTATTPSDVKVT